VDGVRGERSSLSQAMAEMAMYVQLLSAVLRSDEATPCAPGELLSQARTRRHQMLTSADRSRSAERNLAYDVNYDCALIRLCAAEGIAATPASFGQPGVERARLERALAQNGLDLVQRDPVSWSPVLP
jgi:hypothetical protein